MAKFFNDSSGTTKNSFKVAKGTLDASGLTAARTFTLPDLAGTVALTSDARFTDQRDANSLQTKTISATAPTAQQLLTWSGTAWVPASHSGCRVYDTTGQSIANGVGVVVSFGSSRYDTDIYHSNTVNNSVVTMPFAGKYLVGAYITFAGNATGVRQVFLTFSASTYIAVATQAASLTTADSISLSGVWQFAAADYLQVAVYQNSGLALALSTVAGYYPEVWASYLGP